jgi:hypothetical protein
MYLGRLAVQRDLRDLHDLENPNIASSTTDRRWIPVRKTASALE